MVVAEEMWYDRGEAKVERNNECSAWAREDQGLGIHDFNYRKDRNGCCKKEGLDIFLMVSKGPGSMNG